MTLFRTLRSPGFYEICTIAGGLLVICTSISVLFGWYTHNNSLIQIRSDFAPMQYNTALAFLFTGIVLCLSIFRATYVSKTISALVFIIGFSALLQYLFKLDFGIDHLFMEPYVTVKTSHPGRMAPNTSICFTIVAIILFTFQLPLRPVIRVFGCAILSSLLLALAMLSIFGYLSNIEATYSWGNPASMAIHTSISFFVVGSSLLAICLSFSRNHSLVLNWLPLSSAVWIMTVTLVLSMVISALEKSSIKNGSDDFASITAHNVEQNLLIRIQVLKRLSRLITTGFDDVHNKSWEKYLFDYLKDYPNIDVISILDNQKKMHLSFHEDRSLLKSSLSAVYDRLPELEKLSRTDEPFLLLDAKNSAIPKLLVVMPLYRNSEFLGIFFTESDALNLLHTFLDGATLGNYRIGVEINDVDVYTANRELLTISNIHSTSRITLFNLEFVINVEPSRPNTSKATLPTVILICGLIIAIFCYFVVRAQLERIRISTSISEKNKELNRSNAILQQFAYRTSHDLKSPLTTIKGLCRYIQLDIKDGAIAEAVKNIDKISTQTDKLQNLVSDILELSKAELVDTNIIEEINFDELLEEITFKHSFLIDEKNISIVFKNNLTSAFQSEKTRVRQILENLISNGIKYSDASKSEKHVIITCRIEQNMLRLTVEDNGLGIPEDKLTEVFELFKRFHPSAAEGSGMGLAIVQRNVEKLHGKISVRNIDNGSGTIFEVFLPTDNSIKTS